MKRTSILSLLLLGSFQLSAQCIYDRQEEEESVLQNAMPPEKYFTESSADATRDIDIETLLDASRHPVFRVQKPEHIVQGVPFTLTYVLEAPEWGAYTQPEFGSLKEYPGERRFNTCSSSIHGYTGLACIHKLISGKSGRIPVPVCSFDVNGKQVQSEADTLDVEPNPDYGQEMDAAYEIFSSHGEDISRLALNVVRSTPELILLNDPAGLHFALVARSRFWPYIDNKVLVFSKENGLNLAEGDNSVFDDVFLRYTRQLTNLSTKVQAKKPEGAATAVKPLLGCVRWGQSSPYNNQCPQVGNKKAMVGCVAVATSQLLHYYGNPQKIEVASFTPEWSKMECTYSKGESCGDVSALMVAVGTALGARYGSIQTGADLNRLCDVMQEKFGYSKSIKSDEKQPLAAQVKFIREEVSAKRPCVLSDFNHAFLCDGLDGDYLHLNLGWNGFCNGYYLPCVSSENVKLETESFAKVISGIHP